MRLSNLVSAVHLLGQYTQERDNLQVLRVESNRAETLLKNLQVVSNMCNFETLLLYLAGSHRC